MRNWWRRLCGRFWFDLAPPDQTHLEVELTTHCVSKCFACPRTQDDPLEAGWHVGSMDENSLYRFLARDPRIEELVFCGAYGDPIYHPRFLSIARKIDTDFPNLKIFTETNGSHRSTAWWHELGRITQNSPRHIFCFSIDGLRDTNAIYRRDTKWEDIVEGFSILRQFHRGQIWWKWIVFRHNQHQVIEGFQTSRKLGFDVFKLVNSSRHNQESAPSIDFEILHQEVETAYRNVASSIKSGRM